MISGSCLLAVALVSPATAEAPVGRAAPPFELKSLHASKPFSLEAARGQVVLIDFWASWCAPCKRTLPALRDMKARFPSASVLAISVDEDENRAKRFLKGADPEGLLTLHDPKGEVAGLYAIQGMPSAVLIDKGGILRFRHDGYSESDLEKIQIELQVLLKEKP